MTPAVHALLEPYNAYMIDERHRCAAAALLNWSLTLCSCRRGASWHAQKAFHSATFAVLSAPDGATETQTLTAGKIAAFIITADDDPNEELTAMARELRMPRPVADGELGAAYHSLVDELCSQNLDPRPVKTRLADFCAAVASESHQDPGTMAWQEFRALRRNTIGAHPYNMYWIAAWNFPEPVAGSTQETLAEHVVEGTYLGNDLASAYKESRTGAAGAFLVSNSVLLMARRSGDRQAAIDAVITRYNHLVDLVGHTRHDAFGSLMCTLLDGALRSYRSLASTRYPGAGEALGSLRLTTSV
ncbi:terpene synthase family protein [Streptomyces spongiae]|uniref:Terpene synthase n=1 Tax=Streptomyces spongiae TaxID=565072 RepID=A0A5N8XL26_9ACTN|nr:terpene synthase family protein [Streptomyces spongiae]MPY59756.1 hypothetical protein [Streptomyces spongiae]